MSWLVEISRQIRMAWNELFPPTPNLYIQHLEDEVKYLREQFEQVRIDREKLQLQLQTMNPVILAADRQRKLVERAKSAVQTPVRKTWQSIQEDHYRKEFGPEVETKPEEKAA